MKKVFFIIAFIFSINGSSSSFDVSNFENIGKFNVNAMEKLLKMYRNSISVGNFLSKNESRKLADALEKNKLYSVKPSLYLFYFYSSSVPADSLISFARKVEILHENNISVESIVYMRGIPDSFELMIKNLYNKIKGEKKTLPPYAENIKIKFSPLFFKAYQINTVPAIAIAVCDTFPPDPRRCKVDYLARGDISLEEFFAKAHSFEKNKIKKDFFKHAYYYLIANKIHKKR